MRRFFLPVLVVGVLVADGARAQDVAREAERLTQEGMTLAKANRLEDAILRFRSSERLVPRGANDCNIGLAYSMLERHPQALLYLDSCTQREGKDVRPWVPDLKQKTRRALERGKYAEVNLMTEPVGAKVTVGAWGPDVAFTAPRLLWLPHGKHTVRVQATGFVEAQREVQVAAGAPVRVLVELQRTAEPTPTLTPTLTPTPEPPVVVAPQPQPQPVVTAQAKPDPITPPRTVSRQKRALRIAGYTLLGVGAVGGASLIGAGFATLLEANDRGDRAGYERGRDVYYGGYGVGGVLLATGVVLTIVGHLP